MKHVGPLLVLALVVAGFAYYALFAGPSLDDAPAPERVATTTTSEPVEEPERQSFAGAGSLDSLLRRGDNVECAITYIPNPLEPEVTGTFFTANGNVRGDFVVPAPDLSGQVVSSLIYRDDTLYVWSTINGEQYGFTLAAENFTSPGADTPIPTDTEVQYNCLTWPRVDNTIFEPPADVLFTDMTDTSATMETGTIYPTETGEF